MVNPTSSHSTSGSRVTLEILLGLLALTALSGIGIWELFQGTAHHLHVLLVFGALFLSGLAVLIGEFLRNRAALAKQEREHERLRMALVSGKSVAWELDIKAGQDEWLGDLQTMFGTSVDQAQAQVKDFYQYVHPEDRSRVVETIAQARDQRTDYSAEFRIIQKDGGIRWFNATGRFHYGKKGEPLRMLGIAFDVTDRKTAEMARIKSEEKFHKAFFSSPISLALTSMRDHRYIEVNETFEQRSGWRRDEVLGRTPFDINLWVEPSERHSLVKDISQDGKRRLGEFRYRRKDGEQGVALGSAEIIEIDGEPCLLGASLDVTDRHRAEEALRDSEQRFRRVVEHIGDAVIADDVQGRITFANDRFLQMFGFTREQLNSVGLEKYIAPEYRNELVDRHHRRIRGEDVPSHFEYEGLRTDGTRMWLEVDVVSITDGGGNIVGTQSAIRDITERKRAEEALRESEERFRRVVEHIGDALAVDNVAGRVVFANDRFLNLFALNRAEIQNIKFEDYVSTEYCGEVRDRHARRMRGEEVPTHFEFEGIRRDGAHIWLEAEVVPIRDRDGNLVGSQKTLRDITERKKADNALRESEERFRLVANTAPVMIWMSDPCGSCTYVNKPWLDFTGGGAEGNLGEGWKERIHPDDLDAMWMKSRGGFERRESIEVQYRVKRHDGEYRWILDTSVPRFDPDGTFAGYIGSCIDITDRKLAEEAMATVGRRLIEAHEEERTRIARELHDDINQRLALLAVELDRWQEPALPNSELQEKVAHAQNRIGEIAKDVQALSHRLHSSKLEYLGLATAASSFCREFSQQNNLHIDFTHEGVPRNLPQEVALCLFRVLQEALQNCLKYSGVRNFAVNLCGSRGSIELRVADAGIGFEEQEAFRRRGLGLISMRERLQLVHGELSVKSKPGEGTTIYARVPLIHDDRRAIAG